MKNIFLIIIISIFIQGLVGCFFVKAAYGSSLDLEVSALEIQDNLNLKDDEENTSARTLQLRLNNLIQKHFMLASMHLQAIIEGKDTSITSQQLQENGQQISYLLELIYGDKLNVSLRQ